jgi:IS66 Orf2 like protein.
MFRFDPALKVYLHREPVDGRKAINGLALLVEQALGLDPFAPPYSSSATDGATGSRSCCGNGQDSG